MAGIVFPNVANALLPLIQMDRQAEESRLNRERLDRHDQWMQQDRAEARDMQRQQRALQLDAAQRQKLKDTADATTQAALGVLNTPEPERPAAYQTALQFLKSNGHDISKLPPQYMPGMDGMLKFYVQRAESVTEFLKRQADSPQPLGPAGGAPAPGGAAPSGNPNDPLQWRVAIKGNESGGRYNAVGPDTGRGRAYGAYQVMDFNIGPWTQEVLGRAYTPQEFLADEKAQDAVFDAKFGGYVKKYGSPGAASRAWFAGEGGMNNPGAKDVLGTDVAGYERKFTAGLGGPQPGFTPTNMPAQSVPGGLPQMPAQGDNIPGAPAVEDPIAALRTMQLPPGVRFVGKQGVPMIQGDRVLIQLPDNTRQWVPMPAKKEPSTGPFTGTGVEAQALNMLIQNGTLTQQQAAELAAGKTITNPADGSILFMTPSGLMKGAPAGQPGVPQGGPAPPAGGPSGAVQLTPAKKDPAFKKLETEIRAVESAVNNFQKVITEAGGGSWRAFVNDPTSPDAQKVLGAFNAMKTALRSEAFINTGVLQPAEMKMIDDMLLSPQSIRGAMATPEAYGAMLGQVLTYVRNKHDAASAAYGQSAPAASPAPAAPPKVGETQDGYLFKGGDPSKPESWEKVK